MLRVSKLTDYATVVMACLAARGSDLASAQALADSARLEVPTVSKLLKQLAQAGLVVSTRGVNGGYRLARAPEGSEVRAADPGAWQRDPHRAAFAVPCPRIPDAAADRRT